MTPRAYGDTAQLSPYIAAGKVGQFGTFGLGHSRTSQYAASGANSQTGPGLLQSSGGDEERLEVHYERAAMIVDGRADEATVAELNSSASSTKWISKKG